MEYRDLGPKKAFFKSEGESFVVDMASKKMFRILGERLIEVEELSTSLKISLEGRIMDESAAMKSAFHAGVPEGFLEKA